MKRLELNKAFSFWLLAFSQSTVGADLQSVPAAQATKSQQSIPRWRGFAIRAHRVSHQRPKTKDQYLTANSQSSNPQIFKSS
jgi:hypothetical protein